MGRGEHVNIEKKTTAGKLFNNAKGPNNTKRRNMKVSRTEQNFEMTEL